MNEIKTLKADDIELRHDESGAQIIALPVGFELPEGTVSIRKEGSRLVIESTEASMTQAKSWIEFFDKLEPVDVDWPDVDEGLLPLDDIKL